MKKLISVFILFIALGLLASCGSQSSEDSMAEQSKSNARTASDLKKELVLKMYEEFDKGRLADFKSNMSSNFKCNVLGNTDLDWNGFVNFGGTFITAFPDGKHIFDYVIVDGDNVVTIGKYTGTHLGDMQGIAPTNSKIALPVMHLDRVVDGKIVEHRGLANQVQFMAQLGFQMRPQ